MPRVVDARQTRHPGLTGVPRSRQGNALACRANGLKRYFIRNAAVHARHTDVHEDEVGFKRLRRPHTVRTVPRLVHLMTHDRK
jgi:hypothetical protein